MSRCSSHGVGTAEVMKEAERKEAGERLFQLKIRLATKGQNIKAETDRPYRTDKTHDSAPLEELGSVSIFS